MGDNIPQQGYVCLHALNYSPTQSFIHQIQRSLSGTGTDDYFGQQWIIIGGYPVALPDAPVNPNFFSGRQIN